VADFASSKYSTAIFRYRSALTLDMSQTNVADALGLTFQQVRKYEKGTNRIGAGRLQHLSQILQVPVPFFFEGAPAASGIPQAASGGLILPPQTM
jgi:transcriptional regulator with XRE-family HTH domain